MKPQNMIVVIFTEMRCILSQYSATSHVVDVSAPATPTMA